MAVTAVSFRWLDILEKEFDKAFVDLDLLIADLDSDEPEMVYSARQKMSTLSSCFAQLTHKAQAIFQNSAKIEAELVHMRTEVVETKTRNQALEEELHAILVQLHTTQLQQLPGADGITIQNKLQQGLVERSPTHKAVISGVNVDNLVMSLENWKAQLEIENESLRNTLVGLQAEVCGARLAARYLDKELAGRIQQLQLLGRSDMTGEARDRLWSQLEAEILVQRQKTVMRAVRQRESRAPPPSSAGAVRSVQLTRHPHQGLGISITGGREHGVPILISELEPGGNTGQLYVGDAVLSVNGIDLRQASHQEAVSLLSSQIGNVTLKVQYLANGGEESEEDNDFNNLRYGFFDDTSDGVEFYRTVNGFPENRKERPATPTPTAPRTPDSSIRGGSECSYPGGPVAHQRHCEETNSDSPLQKSLHHPAVNQIQLSPRHFGVTTLQKIFRSLTPSGVWSDGTEESKDADDTPEEKSPETANRLKMDDCGAERRDGLQNAGPKAFGDGEEKSPCAVDECPEEKVSVSRSSSSSLSQSAPSTIIKRDGSLESNSSRWKQAKESSQLFHPETEAISLVDGLGDSSFGTPV